MQSISELQFSSCFSLRSRLEVGVMNLHEIFQGYIKLKKIHGRAKFLTKSGRNSRIFLQFAQNVGKR